MAQLCNAVLLQRQDQLAARRGQVTKTHLEGAVARVASTDRLEASGFFAKTAGLAVKARVGQPLDADLLAD